MIEFEYILGGDLILTINARITSGFVGDLTDPPCEPEMEIDAVTFRVDERDIEFETIDIYIKSGETLQSLDSLIEEAGWDHTAQVDGDE